MAFNNFTVSIVTFPEFEGIDFTIANPQAVLLLTPNTGYTLTATSFTPTSPLPNFVSTVVFTQNGLNVDCTITYISPSIMPAYDVLVAVCASGSGTLTPYSISGSLVACDVTNAVTTLPATYSASGDFGSEQVVLTQTVEAASGFYFDTLPYITLTTGNLDSYVLGIDYFYNGNIQLWKVIFTINYTFPNADVSGDEWCLTANAQAIYDPAEEIQSYTFPFQGITIAQGGQSNTFTVFGIEGADWDLEVTNSASTIIATNSGTIDATGSAPTAVVFPAVTADDTYTFTLTGDLSATFDTTSGQPSVFTIDQYIDTQLIFGFTSTNTNFTVGANDSKTFLPFSTIPALQTYTTTATSTTDIIFTSTPTVDDWTNQGGDFAPADLTYNMYVNKAVITIDNVPTTKTITAILTVDIEQAGTPSLTSILDLDNFVANGLTPIVLGVGVDASAACCSGTTANYFILNTETFATATAILLTDGTTSAPDQVYSFGGDYRTQSSGALNSSTACATCRIGLSLCFAVTENGVCCGPATSVTVYVNSGETFSTASIFYANATGSTLATNGFYSNNSGTCGGL